MIALRLFLFILPIQFALSPSEGIDLPLARVFSVLLIIAWLGEGFLKKNMRIGWDIRVGCLFSFWFLLGVSVYGAEEFSWALRKALFLVSFSPLYLVFSDKIAQERQAAILLAKSFVFGAAFSAAIGIVQVALQLFVPIEQLFSFWTTKVLPLFLGQSFSSVVAEYPSLLVNLSGRTVMRASALFPDPHMHAFYLGIALPIAVYFALSKKQLWWMPFLIGIADILTFSRGAYLGGILALFIGALLFGQQIVWRGRKWFLLGISGIILCIIIPNNPVIERFQSGFSLEDGSVNARAELYQEAFWHISERPWFGVGLGNYPLLVKPSALPREPIYTHNLWLDIGVESGVVATLFFALFFFLTMYALYIRWKITKDGFSLAIFWSLLIFFGHSLVETPLFSVQVLPALLLALSFVSMPYEQK